MSPETREAIDQAGKAREYLTDPQMHAQMTMLDQLLDLVRRAILAEGLSRETADRINHSVLHAALVGRSPYDIDASPRLDLDALRRSLTP